MFQNRQNAEFDFRISQFGACKLEAISAQLKIFLSKAEIVGVNSCREMTLIYQGTASTAPLSSRYNPTAPHHV